SSPSHPTFTIAAQKFVTPARRSSSAFVAIGAPPSFVCASNQDQTHSSLPATASGSMLSSSAICHTSGLSGRSCSIFIQGIAILFYLLFFNRLVLFFATGQRGAVKKAVITKPLQCFTDIINFRITITASVILFHPVKFNYGS